MLFFKLWNKTCSFSCTSEFFLFSYMQLLKSGVEFEAVLDSMEYCWEIFFFFFKYDFIFA